MRHGSWERGIRGGGGAGVTGWVYRSSCGALQKWGFVQENVQNGGGGPPAQACVRKEGVPGRRCWVPSDRGDLRGRGGGSGRVRGSVVEREGERRREEKWRMGQVLMRERGLIASGHASAIRGKPKRLTAGRQQRQWRECRQRPCASSTQGAHTRGARRAAAAPVYYDAAASGRCRLKLCTALRTALRTSDTQRGSAAGGAGARRRRVGMWVVPARQA